MLWSIGEAHVCLRFPHLLECPPESTVVYVLQPDEFAQANIARPIFNERRLKAILLVSDETYISAMSHAPDLMDWASTTLAAEPVIPRFAVDGLRFLAKIFPCIHWGGDVESALKALTLAFPAQQHRAAPPASNYTQLVEDLADVRGWRVVLVRDEAEALQLRAARAEARRRGRVLAVGPHVPGWPLVDPAVAPWAALAASGISGEQIAEHDCEAAALLHPIINRPALEALSGVGSLPELRRALKDADLPEIRKAQRARARRALREHVIDDFHHVAAWADVTRASPELELGFTRLNAAALPALHRNRRWRHAAHIAQKMSWFDLAHSWALRAVEHSEHAHGHHHTEHRNALQTLGHVLVEQGRLEEAERALMPMLPEGNTLNLKLDAETDEDLLILMGMLWSEQERHAQSEYALRRALTLSQDDHTLVWASLILSEVKLKQRQIAEAEALLFQSLEALERYDAPDAEERATIEWFFARVAIQQSRPSDAEAHFKRALKHHRANTGEMTLMYATILSEASQALILLDRHVEAEVLARRAVNIFETVARQHPLIHAVRYRLGIALTFKGRPQQAEALLRTVLSDISERVSMLKAQVLAGIARTLIFQGRYAEALDFFEQASALHLDLFGDMHPNYGISLFDFAAHLEQFDSQRSLQLAQRAQKILVRTLDEDHPVRQALEALIETLIQTPPLTSL
ncbi:MAG: tetratricopeptide repeat protein [Bradymonadia bacterium]